MLAAIFRVLALVRKELLAMFKDPRGRAVIFVPAVIQCLIFGYVVNFDLDQVTYAASIAITALPHLSCWPRWTVRECSAASPISNAPRT